MATDWLNADILCPFYHSIVNRQSIVCDGIFPDTKCTNTLFPNKLTLLKHMDLFCLGRWQNCELCQAILNVNHSDLLDDENYKPRTGLTT